MRKAVARGRAGPWVVVAIGLLAPAGPDGGTPRREESAAVLPELTAIAPGLEIDQGPPTGWSHLILKSIPKLASGDLGSLPSSARTTATRFRTAILADVVPVGSSYALAKIGIGLCVPHRGRDTVVTTASLGPTGVDLGTVDRLVLGAAEKEMARGRLAARTPTFALLRSPVMLRVGPAHRNGWLSYAFLVDPASGSLRTLTWWFDADPAARRTVEQAIALRPSLVFDCGLDVAAGRILGTVPVSWSFAMGALPPGTPVQIPSSVQPLMANGSLSPAEVDALERGLRNAREGRRRGPG
jgi:hypothetical protein